MDTHKEFTDRIRPIIIKSHVDLPFEPNITSCHEWINTLPILNPQSTADMMSTASRALLSTPISPIDKFNISEAVKPCVVKLLSTCISTTEGAKLPLTKKQSDLSTQTLEVLTNFHSIYMGIACSTSFMKIDVTRNDEDTPQFSEQQKGLVIYRAIEFLGIIQFFKSLLYTQTDQGFWNDANALFALAEGLHIHQFDYLKIDGEKSTSIENEFKTIHFFHLAQPNRFRQSDIKTIQCILSIHASNILMSSAHEQSAGFYVDLSSSTPISHTSNLTATNNQCRFIDNENLVEFMQSDQVIAPERHGAISLISDKPILPKKTIRQLLPSWSTAQSRQAPRHDQTEEITVYPGFDSIIRALILKQNPNHFSKKSVPQKKNPLDFGIENLHLIPMDEHQKSHHSVNDTDMNRALKASAENSLSSNSIWKKKRSVKPGEKGEAMEAQMNDASLQGLRFKVSANNNALLKASDLIGIQTKNESLQLAIIRRINKLEDGDISVGVEVMAPSLKIANIKFHDKESTPKPVIFLQGIPAINQPDTIISPLLLENTHEDIVLKMKDKVSYYSIDKTIETNQVFTHYTVLKETNLD